MNFKRISSGVVASMLLVGNVAFADEVNTINSDIELKEVSSNKDKKEEDKEIERLKAEVEKNRGGVENYEKTARSDDPIIPIGQKVDIVIPKNCLSYRGKFSIESKGMVTMGVDMVDELRDSTRSLKFTIIDSNGNKLVDEYIDGESFSGKDKITFRTGLEPGEYKLYLAGVTFYDPVDAKLKISHEKYDYVELEPNDYSDSATEILLGKEYKGSVVRYDGDCFKLNLNEDTKVRVVVKETNVINKRKNLRLDVKTANGRWEAISRQHNGEYVYEIPFKKGTNYVEIDNYSGMTDYTLKVSKIDGPCMPMMDTIGDNKEKVTGEVEVGSKVYIKVGNKAYQQANVDSRGDFTLKTGKIKEGTQVRAYATDSKGKKSNIAIAHSIDTTPPAAPKVNQFTVKSNTVTGVTEPKATVKCSVHSSSYDSYQTVADSKGKFSFNVGKLKRGEYMLINAVDTNENSGPNTKVVVQSYVAAPKVNNFSNINVTLTGTGPKGSTVYVKANGKYYKGKVNSSGKFSIKIPKQKYKSVLKLYAKASNGDKSVVVSKTVGYAPKTPVVNTLTTKSTKITGKSSKNAKITVKIGSKYYTGKTTSKGNFSIKIPKCKKGTKVKVQAKFTSTGYKSYPKTVTVK